MVMGLIKKGKPMKVLFRTNIDEAKRLSWPEMNVLPNVGDLVRSTSSLSNIELEVVRRTFIQEEQYSDETGRLPYTVCECELWLPANRWKSISDFENWVKKVRNGT